VATAESIDHLRTAATELIAAARSFLDVAEIAIENPEVVPQVFQLLSRLADVAPIDDDLADDDLADDDPDSNVVNMKGA